jgi:TRAP-type C4-dicarboxylate transport system permease small subunit
MRSQLTLSLAAGSLVALTLLVCYSVFCRYFLGAASAWTYETGQYLMAATVLFGGAHTLSEDAHIRVDIVYDNWKGHRRLAANVAAYAIGFVFCAVLSWQSLALALRSFSRSARSVDMSIPLALPQLLVTLGALMMAIECARSFAGSVSELSKAIRK